MASAELDEHLRGAVESQNRRIWNKALKLSGDDPERAVEIIMEWNAMDIEPSWTEIFMQCEAK